MKNIILCLLLTIISLTVFSQGKNRGEKQGKGPKESGIFKTEVPEQLYNVIIGRTTLNSTTISICANKNIEMYIQYGIHAAKFTQQTKNYELFPQKTCFIELENLIPNAEYDYQVVYNLPNDKIQFSEISTFQTAKTADKDFTFTIQADSHLDENTSTAMYEQTLKNMLTDKPDFLIDLGDTWMTDKYRTDYKDSYKQYLAQRYYFGIPGKSMSVFLTLGNHDGESGQQLKKGNRDNMTNWATQVRRDFYPNPYPNNFYGGNMRKEEGKYYIENYYSWQWGNALFIVLDPFRFTDNNKSPWLRTLGSDQYKWLKKTLESSTAKYKFVFIHNLVGGLDNNGIARGGAEAAKFFEWGGLELDKNNTFKQNRPDWEKPIHDLLAANKVNVVFHGHDHFFAQQELDGIIYQLVPQPGPMRYGNINSASKYGYQSGKILNAPGYLRVKLNSEEAMIDFVQTSTDAQHQNKNVLFSYKINSK